MATQQFSDEPPSVLAAIANNFDGDEQLYQAFAAACAVQFAQDVSAGQVGCDAGDLPALRRLAHNLTSALTMLGHDELVAVAQALESQAAASDLCSARASWRVLCAELSLLRSP
jgi:HPt (histidine-containing phosphotransfer) domain-containing protein